MKQTIRVCERCDKDERMPGVSIVTSEFTLPKVRVIAEDDPSVTEEIDLCTRCAAWVITQVLAERAHSDRVGTVAAIRNRNSRSLDCLDKS